MLPAACSIGQDCWIVSYPDMNPAKGKAQDYTCGNAAVDGNEGADFAIRDTTQMKSGISVLAVAPGKVVRARDGQPDRQAGQTEIDDMLTHGKGCGNGILIDHGHGWLSTYCQLQAGSVAVKPGDAVTPGQKIAEIGQSGAAAFPHLHFALFKDGKTVDPFSGARAEDGCGQAGTPLWDLGITVDYQPLAVFAAGFTAGLPDFETIRGDASSPAVMARRAETLAFWTGIYGLRQGDAVTLMILAPDGKIFAAQHIAQSADQGRQYYYVGRKTGGRLAPGAWRGSVQIERAIAGSREKLQRSFEKQMTVTAE